MEQNCKDVQTGDKELFILQGELHTLKLYLDRSNGQLLLTEDTVQKFTQEKGTTYKDFEGMCRTMPKNERYQNETRDQSKKKMEHVHLEYRTERLRRIRDKTTAEDEKVIVKQQMNLYVCKASGWIRDIDETSDKTISSEKNILDYKKGEF